MNAEKRQLINESCSIARQPYLHQAAQVSSQRRCCSIASRLRPRRKISQPILGFIGSQMSCRSLANQPCSHQNPHHILGSTRPIAQLQSGRASGRACIRKFHPSGSRLRHVCGTCAAARLEVRASTDLPDSLRDESAGTYFSALRKTIT